MLGLRRNPRKIAKTRRHRLLRIAQSHKIGAKVPSKGAPKEKHLHIHAGIQAKSARVHHRDDECISHGA